MLSRLTMPAAAPVRVIVFEHDRTQRRPTFRARQKMADGRELAVEISMSGGAWNGSLAIWSPNQDTPDDTLGWGPYRDIRDAIDHARFVLVHGKDPRGMGARAYLAPHLATPPWMIPTPNGERVPF